MNHRQPHSLVAAELVTAAQLAEATEQAEDSSEFELLILAAALGLSLVVGAGERDFLEELWLCAYAQDDDTDYLRVLIPEGISMETALSTARHLLDVFQQHPLKALPAKFRLHLGQQAGGDLTAMNFDAKTTENDAEIASTVEQISKIDRRHARAIAAERLRMTPQGVGKCLKRHRDRQEAIQGQKQ